MPVLVIAEHDHASLKSATLHAITAGLQMGAGAPGEVHVLVAGHNAGAAAQAAGAVAGVAKVLHADAAHLAMPTAENIAAVALSVLPGAYTHVVAGATGFGKNILPRVAARLDVAQISEITSVVSPDTFVRPIYAGNAFATVQSKDPVKVITVRTTGFDAAAATGGSAAVETVPGLADAGKSKFEGSEIAKNDRPELTAAKIVAPDLYIAIGISGAIQHLAGMKDSKVIVAINKDAEAPIFQVADYGLVADLFQALPELDAELKKAKA